MAAVEILNYMKAAAIDVEMDITGFKIRRDRTPDLDLRKHSFDLAPSGVTDTLAVSLRRYEQDLELAVIAADFQNHAAELLSVANNSVSVAAVNALLYCFSGDYLSVLFKMIVAQPKFFQRSVIERLLIVEYKSFSVVGMQGNKLYFSHNNFTS